MVLTVLIAEAHDLVRDALVARLSHAPGISVVGSAGDPDAALEAAARLRPDAVVLDIGSRNAVGEELVRALAALPYSPPPAILVHATFFLPEHRMRLEQAGATAFVLKDAGGSALLEALRLYTV